MKGEEKLREVMKAQCIHGEDRIGLQDIIGRRSHAEIKEWYSGLELQDRRMFLWIVFSVMSADSAMDIFTKVVSKDFIERQVRQEEARLSQEWDKVVQLDQAVQNSLRTVHRQLRDMRRDVEQMEEKVRRQNREIGRYQLRLDDKCAKIDGLRLQVEGLEDELEEYRIVRQAFEILVK